jgi:xylulokinase
MYLGIDLGTSEVKIVLTDKSGTILSDASSPLTTLRPKPRWSEQDPDQWWKATELAIGILRKKVPKQFQDVCSIGLSGQMHGSVLIDAENKVLYPAILWNDLRSTNECTELMRRVPQFQEISGNQIMPGFTAPKLLWLARHKPEIFQAMAMVLLPKDWLRLKMTGNKISEPSDAAGTLWLDVAKRDWSEKLLAATGMNRSHVPRLIESEESSGTLLPEVADSWGLSHEVLVAGGGSDCAVSAVGIGAVNPNDGFISLGTSGVIFVANECFKPNPKQAVHAFCHALPNLWHQMSVMLSAASCLRWFSCLVNLKESVLLEEIAKLDTTSTANAPLFLPYLSGERTPHNDPYAQGVFHGLSNVHGRAELGYAVIEGVAFGMVDGLEALQNSGTKLTELSLVGGGSRSPYWAQLISDALNIRIITHIGSETGGALGAARLACLAASDNQSKNRAIICAKPPVREVFIPSLEHHKRLQLRIKMFREIYRCRPNKENF